MNGTVQKGKVLGGVVLAILWILCFLYISPTLIIDFGANIVMSFKLFVVLIGLLIIIGYHIYYPSNSETTKLSLTAVLTVVWLSMIIFYPFKDPNNEAGGAVGFFALIGGLAVCVLWVRFFADEIA